ncbi:MAG: TRAP transporter small permease [Rhodospirillaceae bacterium]|nr:TRAP transporter small permease [Rhodospirillaceae bacterium]
MRRALDALYNAAGYLAAFFLVTVLIWVGVGIAGRFFDFYVRGTDAYAGYSMAASGFLALAHTLKKGEHIRVELVLQKVGPRWRRALQLWSYAAATVLAGLFAFYSARLAWQSHVFNDISTANDATPLWLPQIAMALGTLVLFVAFLDELVLELRGRAPAPPPAEATRHE